MKKALTLLSAGLLCVQLLQAQEKKSSDTTRPSLDAAFAETDSLQLKDSLLQEIRLLLDSIDIRHSFVSLSIGVGNRLFSLRNNNINALQGTDSKFNITPTVSYFHKSGLGLMASAYMSIDSGSSRFYQYALSPSYDNFRSGKVAWGLAYTHYFKRYDLDFYASPFEDEVYGYVNARKGWLRPGLSIGWARGTYKEVYKFDTVVTDIFGRLIPIQIRDTTNVSLTDLSVVASVLHNFEWNHVFSRSDNIVFTPQFYVVIAGQQYQADTKGRYIFTKRPRLLTERLRYNYSTSDNTSMQFQSLALSLNLNYFIGKFSLTPQIFLSYYIPESDKKLSSIVSVLASFTF